MGISTRSADPMTADAQALPGTSVTARAAHGITPRLSAVPIALPGRPHPVLGMRTGMRFGSRQQTLLQMAIPAAALVAMTAGAESRIDTCLKRMSRSESRRVHVCTMRFIEVPSRRQRGHARPMTLRTRTLGMATSAQVTRRSCLHSVPSQKALAVHDVTLRARAFAFHVLVARQARALCPLFTMLVTPKTRRHRWPQRSVTQLHRVMTSHAIPSRDACMVLV